MRDFMAKVVAVCLVVLVMTAMSCMACKKSSGQIVKRTQNVKYFNMVDLSGCVEVEFEQGTTPSARIEGNKKLVEKLQLKQVGNRLVIGFKKGSNVKLFGNDKLKVYLTSPNLGAVALRGASEFEVKGSLNTDELNVTVMGSGDAEFGKVQCSNLSCVINGSGDADFRSVNAKSSQVSINGSGDVKLSVANATDARMVIAGSGEIKAKYSRCESVSCLVNGSGEIEAELVGCGDVKCNVNGSGEVKFKGDANSLTKAVRGSGKINTHELKLAR